MSRGFPSGVAGAALLGRGEGSSEIAMPPAESAVTHTRKGSTMCTAVMSQRCTRAWQMRLTEAKSQTLTVPSDPPVTMNERRSDMSAAEVRASLRSTGAKGPGSQARHARGATGQGGGRGGGGVGAHVCAADTTHEGILLALGPVVQHMEDSVLGKRDQDAEPL